MVKSTTLQAICTVLTIGVFVLSVLIGPALLLWSFNTLGITSVEIWDVDNLLASLMILLVIGGITIRVGGLKLGTK